MGGRRRGVADLVSISSGGGEALSRETGVPLLGSIPIDIDLRRGGDSGTPLMVTDPDGETGAIFKEIVEKLSGQDDMTATMAGQG